MKKEKRVGFHVRVDVEGAYGLGMRNFTEKDWIRECEGVKAQIERHVDGVHCGRSSCASVAWDTEATCSFCGYTWTEDNPECNGGCCAQDVLQASMERIREYELEEYRADCEREAKAGQDRESYTDAQDRKTYVGKGAGA